MKNTFLTLFLLFLFASTSFAQNNTNYTLELIISSLNKPWSFVFISKNKILINQKNGEMLLVDLKTKKRKNIKHNLQIDSRGQGGLLDLKKSPFFKKDSYLYLTYVQKNTSFLSLARAKYKENSPLIFHDIFISTTKSNTNRHFGSRIAFHENNHIFISLLERGERKNAQKSFWYFEVERLLLNLNSIWNTNIKPYDARRIST